MKQLFHIKRGYPENALQVLSLRLGGNHACFSCTDKTGNELYELAYCSMDTANKSPDDFFTRYGIFQHSFYKIFIAYDYPQSILTPSAIYQPESAPLYLNAMHGVVAGSLIISERIAEWQLYNTYAVPHELHKWLNGKFPAATFRHQYTIAVKKMMAAGQTGNLWVDFRTDDFAFLIAKDSKILLAQCFPYTTPEDVIYYLLKSCRQFSLSPKEVSLQLSGLLDKNSALFNELYQYFMNMQFRVAGWNTDGEFPAHFFTSLNDLARCAS